MTRSYAPWARYLWIAGLALTLAACDDADVEPIDPVTNPALASEWEALVVDLVREEFLFPPAAGRLYAYAGVGLYEGLVHGYPTHRSLSGQLNGMTLPEPDPGEVYDWYTVASTTERALLTVLFEDAAPETYQRINDLYESQTASRRAAGVSEDVIVRSIAFGEQLAAAIDAWCQTDRYAETRNRPYTPPTGDAMWVPTPPQFLPALEPYWGEIRTLALENSSECDIYGDPPAYSLDQSSPFWVDLQEVYDISQNLTEYERSTAFYWADNPGETGTPPGHWVSIARQLNDQLDLSLIEAAETFALVGIALNDAFQTAWQIKYRTNFARPVTMINRLIDPTWEPLFATPPFPDFPSGHSTGSGALIEVLPYLHGANTPFTDATHVNRGMPARSFGSFEEAALEASFSRLYGGIHYRRAKEMGIEIGRCVGEHIVARVHTRS